MKQLLAEFKITDSLRFNLLDYSINACQTVTDRLTDSERGVESRESGAESRDI